jgi:hypothetical protein
MLFASAAGYRLTIDLWPRARQAELVAGLRQGRSFKLAQVGRLRRALEKDILRRKDGPFDPHDFLLKFRRRRGRLLYVATLVMCALAVILGWRLASIYTDATDKGFEMSGFLPGQEHFYSYQYVAQVRLQCWKHPKGGADAYYEVVFKDGRSTELLNFPASLKDLDSVAHVDRQLRRARARFLLYIDKEHGVGGVRACVKAIARNPAQEATLTEVMHLEHMK